MDEELKSDDLEDEDFENLETPSSPPIKPPNLLNFYIEENRQQLMDENTFSTQEANARLRQIFKEELGQKEKQKWKRKHKKLQKRFEKLLELYKSANPLFDAEKHYEQQKQKSRVSPTKRTGVSSGSGHQRKFIMQEFDDSDNLDDDDNYDNNYYSNNNNNSKSKSPKSQKQRKRRRLTKKGNEEGDGSKMIDSLLDDISKQNSKRRRKKENFIVEKKEIEKMKEFVQKMRTAARDDWTSNLMKQPTLNMFRMLEKVVSELSKKLLHQYFLDECNILDAIRDWVHPLPDGSLPPVKIRTEMYRIIEAMEIHKEEDCLAYLEGSEERSRDESFCQIADINAKFGKRFKLKGLCKTLMTLWAHEDETAENKKMLRKIMDKLIRKLTPQANVTYAELREENVENKESLNAVIERNRIEKKRKELRKKKLGGSKKRASIPQKPSFDFLMGHEPKSNIDNATHEAAPKKLSKYGNVEAKFKKLKKNASNNQAYKPSLTGRRY